MKRNLLLLITLCSLIFQPNNINATDEKLQYWPAAGIYSLEVNSPATVTTGTNFTVTITLTLNGFNNTSGGYNISVIELFEEFEINIKEAGLTQTWMNATVMAINTNVSIIYEPQPVWHINTSTITHSFIFRLPDMKTNSYILQAKARLGLLQVTGWAFARFPTWIIAEQPIQINERTKANDNALTEAILGLIVIGIAIPTTVAWRKRN